jgi:hypothetical protein
MIIPMKRQPVPRVPVPLFGPPRQRVVDPDQTDIVEYLEAHPPAGPTAVESQPMPSGLMALRVSDPDPDDLPDHEIPACPASRTGNAALRPVPRMPLIGRIVLLAQVAFGQTWSARAAHAMGVSERHVRRWRALGNPAEKARPTPEHMEALLDAAEERHAEMQAALRAEGRLPPAEAPALKAADAPHVRRREPVPEAGALPVELGEPGRVEPFQAAREGAPVEDG